MEIMSTAFVAKVVFIALSLAFLKAVAFRLRYGVWGAKPQTEEGQIITLMETVIALLLLELNRSNFWLIPLGVFALSYIPTTVNFVFSKLSSKN